MAGIWATNLAMNSYKAKWNPAQYQHYPSSKTPHHAQSGHLGWAPPAQEFDPAAIFSAAANHQAPRQMEGFPPDSPRKRSAMWQTLGRHFGTLPCYYSSFSFGIEILQNSTFMYHQLWTLVIIRSFISSDFCFLLITPEVRLFPVFHPPTFTCIPQ